jgi:FkbM family methyltransferase
MHGSGQKRLTLIKLMNNLNKSSQSKEIIVDQYQKRLSFLDKVILVAKTIKSPYKIFIDKLGLANEVFYQTKNNVSFLGRSKSTDVNEGIVVLSGYEYPRLFFGNLPINPTIIDCGGNIGLFALYVKKIFPTSKVISLEPLPANIIQFEKNIALNKNANEIKLIPKGISVDGEDINFLLEGNHFDGVHATKDENENTFKVSTITLGEIIKQNSIESIDILKVDIEGGEFDILTDRLDLLKSKVSRIIVEYHTKVEPQGRSILLDYLTNDDNFTLEYETTNLLVLQNKDKVKKVSGDLVSIIVPTRNSEHLMTDFFNSSLNSKFKNFEIIVNDDVRSADNLQNICNYYISKGLNVKYIRENKSMAQGRVSGSAHAIGDIILHLDSDMRISRELIGECVDKINEGFDALVIPEESYGIGFWARVKWLEKKCYDNVEWMESLRCIRISVYNEVGGHNLEMVFSEDKDLDIRVREAGYRIGRTENGIRHFEGELKLLGTLKKKMGYSKTSGLFKNSHPMHYRKQGNIFLRYYLYLINIKYLFTNPLIYTGLIFLKTGEFLAVVFGILKSKIIYK